MSFVPRDASDEQVLDIIRGWIDVLSEENYTAVFNDLGLSIGWITPGPECIQACIQEYRSPEYYPGIEEFAVTDWRTAQGGNPEPARSVEWYEPNSVKMAGSVSFDLPLNGRWSDLTADFVFFENDNPEGYDLILEEISSWEQVQRDIAEMEPELSDAEASEQEDAATQLQDAQPPMFSGTSRFNAAGEHISQKQD
jgi:hypothetical protein